MTEESHVRYRLIREHSLICGEQIDPSLTLRMTKGLLRMTKGLLRITKGLLRMTIKPHICKGDI